MLRPLLKPLFEKFGQRYDYNVDYMSAMAELSLAIAFGSFYPTMKRALGAATACEPVVAELAAQA